MLAACEGGVCAPGRVPVEGVWERRGTQGRGHFLLGRSCVGLRSGTVAWRGSWHQLSLLPVTEGKVRL